MLRLKVYFVFIETINHDLTEGWGGCKIHSIYLLYMILGEHARKGETGAVEMLH